MRRRWYHLYALLIGVLGLGLLVWLFSRLSMLVELPSLLLFTVIALTSTYFRVPVCISPSLARSERTPELETLCLVDLGLDGALLLGATLAGGPSFGGWTAFIIGLVHSILPSSIRWHRISRPNSVRGASVGDANDGPSTAGAAVPYIEPEPAQGVAPTPARTWRQRLAAPRGSENAGYSPWLDRVATGLFNGGRNVIAVTVAWFAYRGMGGQLAPIAIGTVMAFALLSLYVVYILVRRLCAWPALVIEGLVPSRALEGLIVPSTLLIELLPLPVSLLVSATFVHLGWPFFLTLALVFIGLGAITQQLIEVIETSRQQVDDLLFRYRVAQAFARAPAEVDALCALTYPLCSDIPEPFKLEVGLYNPRLTHIHVRVYAGGDMQLPPMYIPLTPMWRWLSELNEPLLIETEAELDELPFTLPPLEKGQAPRAAIFVPLMRQQTGGTESPQHDETTSGEKRADAPDAAPERGLPRLTQPPLGAIVLQSSRPEILRQQDVARLIVIAEHLALALQNL